MTDQYADTILLGGHVKTSSGWAQGLALRAGVIERVGGHEDVLHRRGPGTRVVDLAGDTVLPGLHDLHVHPIYAGIRDRRCKVPQGSSLAATLRIVAEHVERLLTAVGTLATDRSNQKIVRSILNLAESLGLQTVARASRTSRLSICCANGAATRPRGTPSTDPPPPRRCR